MKTGCDAIPKHEWYDFIISHTADPREVYERPWAECLTPMTRALAYSKEMLKYYQERDDQSGIEDTEWAISKIKKVMEQR